MATDTDGGAVYVSITGLRLKSWRYELRFWRLAIASMAQARRAEGNISASARTINGVRHTLTVWENERAMRRFLYQGAHRRAIAAFDGIATGLTFGFEAARAPDWADVHALWLEHGREYAPG